MSVHPIFTECVYCGAPQEHMDHVVPKSMGGKRVVPACRGCNLSKGARTAEEWIASLIERPRALTWKVTARLDFLIITGVVDRHQMEGWLASLRNQWMCCLDDLATLCARNDLDLDKWERWAEEIDFDVEAPR